MHEDPQVPNYGAPGKGPLLEEGMVLAMEPMTTAGRAAVRMGGDGWAIFSQDGSPAAHFEFTVAITGDGPRILTPWHEAGAQPGAARRGRAAPAIEPVGCAVGGAAKRRCDAEVATISRSCSAARTKVRRERPSTR